MAVLDCLHLGSAISLRTFARFSSSMSVLDFVHLGSSLSLRSFARLGVTMSVFFYCRFVKLLGAISGLLGVLSGRCLACFRRATQQLIVCCLLLCSRAFSGVSLPPSHSILQVLLLLSQPSDPPSAAGRAVALSKYTLAHEIPEHFAKRAAAFELAPRAVVMCSGGCSPVQSL